MAPPKQQQQQPQPLRTKTTTISRRAADDCCFPLLGASSRARDHARSRPSAWSRPTMWGRPRRWVGATTQTDLLGQTRWRTFTVPSTTSSCAWRSGISATRRCRLRTWNSSVRCVFFCRCVRSCLGVVRLPRTGTCIYILVISTGIYRTAVHFTRPAPVRISYLRQLRHLCPVRLRTVILRALNGGK